MKTFRQQSGKARTEIRSVELDVPLRMRLFRVAAGLKQRDVAEKLGVSSNYISMIERGKREPTLRFLQSFAKLVGVPPSVILWEAPGADKNVTEVEKLQNQIAALMAEYAATLGIER